MGVNLSTSSLNLYYLIFSRILSYFILNSSPYLSLLIWRSSASSSLFFPFNIIISRFNIYVFYFNYLFYKSIGTFEKLSTADFILSSFSPISLLYLVVHIKTFWLSSYILEFKRIIYVSWDRILVLSLWFSALISSSSEFGL